MIAKVTTRTELGPLRALPTVRHARVERGIRLSPAQCRAAHAASVRSPSQSVRNPTTEFQLRIVGVTAIGEPGFGRASTI